MTSSVLGLSPLAVPGRLGDMLGQSTLLDAFNESVRMVAIRGT